LQALSAHGLRAAAKLVSVQMHVAFVIEPQYSGIRVAMHVSCEV